MALKVASVGPLRRVSEAEAVITVDVNYILHKVIA
jgi:hypothetical protein